MMEYDSQSQCSDEGVDLSSSDLGEVYPTDYAFLEDSQPAFLEAKVVYILMQNSVPVSRASRLQWLLDHLNTVIIPSQKLTDTTNILDVISAIPREQNVTQCNRFLITYRTEVKFLAHNYRFVYCIDMSPSHANVDIQKGEILFDEILNCFKASLGGLCREFMIPGTSVIFRPCVFLTVIVNTPFFMSPAQQVLVKGVKITETNLEEITKYVEKQFHLLEKKIAHVSAAALDHLELQCIQNEGLVSDLFDLPETNKIYSQVPIVTPDVNFVNMLRYSMLAISLLPENSLGHILVITDGIVAMPDSNIMESLLYQLHYDSISCSFLKVGSSFHPHAGAGFVSYTDLLYFFAQSTLGTCLENFVHIKNDLTLHMNIYHELFLLWSFHSANKYACSRICGNNIWTSLNDTFCSHKVPSFICKRQTDENTNSTILLVLSRRMREGFTVDNIFYLNGNLEIKMILKWQSSIYIHYNLSVEWPSNKNPHYEIYMSAPYEFLHDLTCILKKEPKSLFRQAVIERFWMRLTQIQSDDLGLATKLSSFQMCKDWYMIPESVKNGIPVFILNNITCSEATRLVLAPSDIYCHKFVNIWQPICQIETTNWKKWFHAHKISLLLRHDTPLPKYLHMASSSQRFQHVQCRQAATALYGLLAEWASFILVDNHTYIKLLYNESEKPPTWFCIVRISSKFPCAVINIGFTTGTPGYFRHQVCEKLKMDLAALSYLSSPLKVKENFCCILLQKPLEKILIRYERIPRNYSTVVFPDGTQPPHTVMNLPSPLSGSLFTTLSRYLFHKRWIWSATLSSNPKLPDHALARILNTLTRMRLKEGFNFAHSASGIITMAIELWMEPTSCCIFQYVLFPPHQAWLTDELYSGSDDDNEQSSDTETELQMVTEVWIEPQYGKVVPSNPRIGYIDNKYYYEIADAVNSVDFHCISALLTMEHLSLMCQGKKQNTLIGSLTDLNQSNLNASRRTPSGRCSRNSFMDFISMPEEAAQWYPITSPRIEHIPFKFDPIGVLNLCQQTELLFSMFIETKEKRLLTNCSVDKANSLLLENILEHLGLLHDQELELTKEDSDRFNQEILLRHKNTHPHVCPIAETISHRDYTKESEKKAVSQWRCFIKGVSVTHVILTFVVATLEDLKLLVGLDNVNIPELNEGNEGIDRASSRESNYSDVPINTSNSICLPIYVYDCPLARLVNAFVYNGEDHSLPNEDIYEDHRFKHGSFLQEETVKLKSEEPDYQDYKEDSETERKSVKQHCKTLVLTHSKCFTISLFVALHHGAYIHSYDVQSSMDQCEESITEIDITEYLMTICAHVKQTKTQDIPISELHQAFPCCELKKFHMMIREKFYKTINTVFYPIHSNSEFYFYKNLKNYEVLEPVNVDSDDEVSDNLSDIVEFKSDKDFSIFSEGPHLLQRMESGVSGVSDMVKNSDVSPLFLHLICTLKYDSGEVFNTSVRVIPTCLGELVQHFLTTVSSLDKSKIQITLDMLCLTLPPDVQNIINDYSTQGLRSTSFCSDGFQPSIGSSISDASYNSQISEPLKHLSENQKKAILSLQEEIKWLLQDEICTALLDLEPVTLDTLNYVMQHVNNSGPVRPSCLLDTIDLNFVYASEHSHKKFEEEFSKLTLPYSGYKLCKESELYYIAKDPNYIIDKDKISYLETSDEENLLTVLPKDDTFYDKGVNINLLSASRENVSNVNENIMDVESQQSDMSSLNESATGTDGGYDEDMSEDFDDYDWLITFDKKRPHLPNFWLIMNVAPDVVTVYFHCRFLELPTNHIGEYIEIQRGVCEAVKDLCKRVNQMLLLQSLYESKACDPLLELDDSSDICNSPISRNTSFARLKSLEVAADNNDDFDMMAYSQSLSEASFNFKPGYFSCPVVWETHFILHPRLKTGPGKSGISRGILALKNILDKFSVSNRNNMFVYRDTQNNVFYLRLHENVQCFNSKASLSRPSEFETGTVSRSPSFASLPLGQKSALTQSQQSISSATSGDIRPRVRSFGEKESKDTPNGDTLTLRVHGINEAGSDVQHDLVQVLQNRLDDAVLEFLSVMLARNAMCPLTPEDVHFIQKPFRPPEVIIKLTIQEFALRWLESFVHYLKQNLLLFLNIPKYSDNRSHYHFKDYVETEDINHPVYEDNIFIYNQSQNPSSGSRGIACIALTLINGIERVKNEGLISFTNIFETKEFETIVASEIISDEEPHNSCYLEFRLWKQGRVNIENLSSKLKSAVSQATWDIILEYYLLKEPPCSDGASLQCLNKLAPVRVDSSQIDLNKEIEFNCDIDMYVEKTTRGQFETPRYDYLFLKKKKGRPLFPPLPQKAKRSITFNDMEKDKGQAREKYQLPKIESKLNSYEVGDKGILSVIYSKYLPSWLDFGHTLNTPSIKKHRVVLANRHLSDIIIAELLSMLPDTTKAFYSISTNRIKSKSKDIFVPFITAHNKVINKYIIISRNLEQWSSTINITDRENIEFPDTINPNILKHTQKFVPTICNNVFIPRQKILWIAVESDCIIMYTYNWVKDNIDKLITSCTNLGLWLSVRSCFLNSVTSQKLGLFHNQPLTRKVFMIPNNPYSNFVGSCEHMISFPKDHLHKKGQSTFNLPSTLEVFRDNFKICKFTSLDQPIDPTFSLTQEMRAIKSKEKTNREEMKILHGMYQSRTSTVTVPQLKLLIQNARIVHYCHTPLLFLPRWRLKTASTRDHSLYPSQAIQLADKLVIEDKELWHKELCYAFFLEYRHYMQTLGFMPLQIDNPRNNSGMWTTDKSCCDNVFYIQKTILGGILIFTAEFKEPFFTTKLLAIECNRLQNISSRASINRFTLSFLDECDRVKILMHLHSFTYDYHLRCIYNYISGTPSSNKICERYNINQFLDDFLKYYNKAPNFARNLVHTDTLTIKDLVTQGQQLYQYLLSNVSQYDFKVLEMEVWEGELEYILFQVTSTPQVSYKDSQDQQRTDDFDITLVVHNMCTPYSPSDKVLHLRYYLILTSKREIYPKSEVEEKLGKFRTVSSTTRSLSTLEKEVDAEDTLERSQKLDTERLLSSDSYSKENDATLIRNQSSDSVNNGASSHVSQQSSSIPYVEIYQESVNYLGYYSSHEQLMQQLILDKASATQQHIKNMVEKGMVHCRTHLLWNRLISPQDTNNLTYDEFLELKSLAKLEHLCHMHPNLGPLLNQPLGWYQGLAKLLLIKYADHNRSFISPDGNIQHHVILDQRYFGAFMLLSMDLHTARGDLYAVYREPQRQEDTDLCLAYQKSLLDGFINCICFYLWSGMISN